MTDATVAWNNGFLIHHLINPSYIGVARYQANGLIS